MISVEKRVDKFIQILSKLRIQDLNVDEIVRLLGTHVSSQGCFLVHNDRVVSHNGISEASLSRIELFMSKKNVFSEDIEISGSKYRMFLVFEIDDELNEVQIEKLRSLLAIISQSLSISNLARTRISEFQVINELNLNVITTMDIKKVIWFSESAARRLLDTDGVYVFYLVEDQLLGRDINLSIKIIPDDVYLQLSRSRQILKLEKRYNKFLKSVLSSLSGIALIVPFTIKNQVRGFFLLDNFERVVDPTNAIMRLKFLGNQVALALERIELFQALSKALQESRGLQEVAKLLLSPYEMKYFFGELLRRAQNILRFKKIMYSTYNPDTDSFRRVHSVGISARKFRVARKTQPPYTVIKSLLQDRFRVSNSYYIPSEEVHDDIHEYEVYKSKGRQKRIHNLWSPGDILISPIYSRDGNLLGMLSLADPVNNRVPDRDKIRLLEAFGDFLGLAIESNLLFEKNIYLSYTDDLTGVYNYRFLKEKLTDLLSKEPKSLAIAMIDLDRFKEYNDQFGHLTGDLLLKKISQILKGVVKDGYVTRYGGDEFIIVLPNANCRRAQYYINKARQIIVRSKQEKFSIQFSAGIATFPEDGKDFGSLIDRADKRLYQEKRRKYDTISA